MLKLVILDWKRTLYDPDSKKLITGAKKLLKLLKFKKVSLILIGKGGVEMHDEVKKFKIEKLFDEAIFIGAQKSVDIFKPFVLRVKPNECLFIGDRVRSELQIGKKLGAFTLWVKQGRFASENPENKFQEPDYSVNSLDQCFDLIAKTFAWKD